MSMDSLPMRLLSLGRLYPYTVRGNVSFESRMLNKPDMFRMTRQSTPFKKRMETDQKFIRTKGDLMPCLRGNFRGNGGRKRNLLKSSPVMFNLHENLEAFFESERLCLRKSRVSKRFNKRPRSGGHQSGNRSPRLGGSNSTDYRQVYGATIDKSTAPPVYCRNTQNSRSAAGLPSFRVVGRDENSCTPLSNKNEVLAECSKFLAEKCAVGTLTEMGDSDSALPTRVPEPNYKIFPLLQDDDNFYKPSSLQKFFATPSAQKKNTPRMSTVIRKLFPEKRVKNRTSPSRVASADPCIRSRSRISSPGNNSCLSANTSVTSKRRQRPSTYRPSTARRLDPTKRSTFEYFMKKLSQLSSAADMQIPYQYAYPRKRELRRETREEYADKIANVFEHNLRKFSKFKRSPKKTERKMLPKAPKWKY